MLQRAPQLYKQLRRLFVTVNVTRGRPRQQSGVYIMQDLFHDSIPLLNREISTMVQIGLSSDWMESESGFCWRAMRQALERVESELILIPPRGVDAAGAERWYKGQGLWRDPRRGSIVGDILFQSGHGHGRHGHVGCRIFGNRVGENSSVHCSGTDRDARGVRDLASFGALSGIVRFVHQRPSPAPETPAKRKEWR